MITDRLVRGGGIPSDRRYPKPVVLPTERDVQAIPQARIHSRPQQDAEGSVSQRNTAVRLGRGQLKGNRVRGEV
jgi:hypothetical protein